MKTLSFNTGRSYSSAGQPIVAAQNEDGVTFFYDRGCMIEGWITRRLGVLTPEAILLNYDAGNYVTSPPDLLSKSDSTMISDAATMMLSAPLCTALDL